MIVSRKVTGTIPAAAALFVLLAILAGCGRDDGPTSIPNPLVAPPAPSDLTAVVGEDRVSLAWEIASMEGIASFVVYRADEANPDERLIDSTAVASYEDTNLVPGRAYTYTVAAVGANGTESARSGAFVVTPGTYGMVIDDRAEYTSGRTVTLVFTAPGDVTSIRIGNDSLLTGAFFEVFQPSRAWTLTDGDGSKTVYARFRTSGGVVSGLYEASIILDTGARIVSLNEDSDGKILTPGDTLRITMDTGEGGGSAAVTVGDGVIDVPLSYDESSSLYRAEVLISPAHVMTGAVLTGTFTDRAGNVATPFLSPGTVTVADPEGAPTPVVLDVPVITDTGWIALSWSRNEDADFAEYRVYRGPVPSVEATDGDDQVIAVLTDRDATAHVDSLSLADTTRYFYRVFVKDTEDHLSGSNEVAVFTRNSPPPPVESFSAAPVDSPSTAVRLTWSSVEPSAVGDFASYVIYRSVTEAVSDQSQRIALINGEIGSRTYIDTGTEQATTYYYRLYVVDRGGLSAGSAVASASATDLPPSFPALSAPNVDVVNQNVSLSWLASGDADFASYVIYFYGGENQNTPSPSSFAAIDTVRDAASSTYAHYPNVVLTPFYAEYFVDAVDRAGHRTRSNVVQAVFGEAGLPSIDGIVVTARDTEAIITFQTDVPATAVVSYSRESLQLDLSEAEGAGLQISHAVTLTGLVQASEYFYQVEVTDERGVKNYSGIGSFTTDITDTVAARSIGSPGAGGH